MHYLTLIAILLVTAVATVASALLHAPEVGSMLLIVGPMLAGMLALHDGAVSTGR